MIKHDNTSQKWSLLSPHWREINQIIFLSSEKYFQPQCVSWLLLHNGHLTFTLKGQDHTSTGDTVPSARSLPVSHHRCCRAGPGRLATASVVSASRRSPGCRRSPRGRGAAARASRCARSPSSRCSRCPGCCAEGSPPPPPPVERRGARPAHQK